MHITASLPAFSLSFCCRLFFNRICVFFLQAWDSKYIIASHFDSPAVATRKELESAFSFILDRPAAIAGQAQLPGDHCIGALKVGMTTDVAMCFAAQRVQWCGSCWARGYGCGCAVHSFPVSAFSFMHLVRFRKHPCSPLILPPLYEQAHAQAQQYI